MDFKFLGDRKNNLLSKVFEEMYQLIQEAIEMYLDRDQSERDLIYHVASMSSEDRTALIIAYEMLKEEEDEES